MEQPNVEAYGDCAFCSGPLLYIDLKQKRNVEISVCPICGWCYIEDSKNNIIISREKG